jgi:hypothetical protein
MKKLLALLALFVFTLSFVSCDAVAEQDETAELYDTFSPDGDGEEPKEKKD